MNGLTNSSFYIIKNEDLNKKKQEANKHFLCVKKIPSLENDDDVMCLAFLTNRFKIFFSEKNVFLFFKGKKVEKVQINSQIKTEKMFSIV